MADYCTRSEVKSAMRISDTVDDSKIDSLITMASRWVDGYCERNFDVAAGTATKDYTPSGLFEVLPIDDATNIVSIKIDDGLDGTFATTLTTADWQGEPVNAEVGGIAFPYTRIRPFNDAYWPIDFGRATVRVQATYGWPALPEPVKLATILQTSRLFTRYDSPLGVAGFGEMGVMRVSRFTDPDVEALLDPYRRKSI